VNSASNAPIFLQSVATVWAAFPQQRLQFREGILDVFELETAVTCP